MARARKTPAAVRSVERLSAERDRLETDNARLRIALARSTEEQERLRFAGQRDVLRVVAATCVAAETMEGTVITVRKVIR